MAQGDQIVQILQSHLILCQQNHMVRLAAGGAAAAAHGLHVVVDLTDPGDAILLQHLEEFLHHIGHRNGVVAGPVMIELRQGQMVCHNIQLVFFQIRQQILCHDQSIHRRIRELQSHLRTAQRDKSHIKIGVVRHQRPVSHKLQKGRQRLQQAGCIRYIAVPDAGQFCNLLWDVHPGVHKSLELLADLPIVIAHGANFRNLIPAGLQTGCLDVKGHELSVERCAAISVNHNAVIHIVDVIGLHTINQFDLIPRRMPGVGKALTDTVIRNRNGGMAPFDGLFDQIAGIGQRIQRGIAGMQMQFHPFFRRRVLPLLLFPQENIVGLHDHFIFIPVVGHFTLDFHPHAGLDLFHQRCGPIILHELADADGTRIVGDVKIDDPGIALGQLPVIDCKDLTFDTHPEHIQIQLGNGYRFALEGLSKDHVRRATAIGCPLRRSLFPLPPRFVRRGGRRIVGQSLLANAGRLLKQRILRDVMAAGDIDCFM